METAILLPTYNEALTIRNIINEIHREVPDANVIVIDDNSPDGTAAIVKDLQLTAPYLHLFQRQEKAGLGRAYIYAIQRLLAETSAQRIITMDADGSHHPKYLPLILDTLQSNDLVVGSRYIPGGNIENWERWRYFLSKYGNLYANLLTRLSIQDITAGFVGVRRDILEKIDFSKLSASGYAYQIEFKYHAVKRAGARSVEIPITFLERRGGESKISRHIILEGIKTPVRLFFSE